MNSLPSLPLRENAVFLKVSASGYSVLFMCLFPDVECEKSSQLTFFSCPVFIYCLWCCGCAVPLNGELNQTKDNLTKCLFLI